MKQDYSTNDIIFIIIISRVQINHSLAL